MATRENVESIGVNALTGVQKRQLAGLKRGVIDASKGLANVREKLSDLAPRVIALFNSIIAENVNFTFVEFCRLFDPSVPTNAADRDGQPGYRNHRVYYTLDYMRRLVRQAGQQRRGRQGVRDSAVDDLARMLATVLQIVSDPDQVWNAVQAEFHYSERVMTRLRRRVENTKPVLKLAIPKPVKVSGVIHMEPQRPEEGAAEAAEPMRQAGRNVAIEEPAAPRARSRKRAA